MEKLFSYGTLQLEQVQFDTFGRKLYGKADKLICYKLEKIKIHDKNVLNSSGIEYHPIVKFTGNKSDIVEGVIFEVSKKELKQADTYEEENYIRIKETFQSGIIAWVYIENKKVAKE